MFKQATIHYPADENASKQVSRDIAAFRCAAVVKYIETLKLNDRQIETLFACLAKEIAERRQKNI